MSNLTKDLVNRLRAGSRGYNHMQGEHHIAPTQIEVEAADELQRLNAVIESTAKHWLALSIDHPVEFEGGIDGAMEAACREIRRLRAELAAMTSARDAYSDALVKEARRG